MPRIDDPRLFAFQQPAALRSARHAAHRRGVRAGARLSQGRASADAPRQQLRQELRRNVGRGCRRDPLRHVVGVDQRHREAEIRSRNDRAGLGLGAEAEPKSAHLDGHLDAGEPNRRRAHRDLPRDRRSARPFGSGLRHILARKCADIVEKANGCLIPHGEAPCG